MNKKLEPRNKEWMLDGRERRRKGSCQYSIEHCIAIDLENVVLYSHCI